MRLDVLQPCADVRQISRPRRIVMVRVTVGAVGGLRYEAANVVA
jgi:hypothetical protein